MSQPISIYHGQNHKNEIKVPEPQFVMDFQRSYMRSFISGYMVVPRVINVEVVFIIDIFAIPTNEPSY